MENQTAPTAPQPGEAKKQGFLAEDFRLFHLAGPARSPAPHYHDFCKILLFLDGDVDYVIEGRTYGLRPGDIVLVGRGEIHCPHVRDTRDYDRIILYLSLPFLREVSGRDPLDQCFDTARFRHSSVLRLGESGRQRLFAMAGQLERAYDRQEEYAGPLLARLLLLEFMIALNRAALDSQAVYIHTGSMNYRVSGLISYISGHLDEELSISRLAEVCCLSPYHMMRLFKEETGCTIGNYITQKRLSLARDLLASGQVNATQACFRSGFSNYSTFLRAYKRHFNASPRESISSPEIINNL